MLSQPLAPKEKNKLDIVLLACGYMHVSMLCHSVCAFSFAVMGKQQISENQTPTSTLINRGINKKNNTIIFEPQHQKNI